MSSSVLVAIFLVVALLAAVGACTARSVERLLVGAVICSLGLGLATQVFSGSYYGFLMMAAFLVTDLLVYLFFRTQNILPAGAPRNLRADRLFRVFFLWAGACAVAGVGFTLAESEIAWLTPDNSASSLALLHERIWGQDWLLVLIPVLALVALVIGGFFLVRREK